MAVDFNEIVKYANKAGIFDIEEAFNLYAQGKLPENKIKALKDVVSYAKEKGVDDLQTVAYKYEKDSGAKKHPLAKYAMEKDLESLNKAFFAQLDERVKGGKLVNDYAASLGYNTKDQKQMNEFNQRYGGDEYQALEAARRWQAQNPQQVALGGEFKGPNPMTGEPKGFTPKTREELAKADRDIREAEKARQFEQMREKIFKANMTRADNYNKLISGGVSKEQMESDPLWGSPAYREQVLKENPSTLWHDEETFNAVRNSDLYKKLQGLGTGQPSPERETYNKLLSDYRYDTLKRNPANWFNNNHEYLRPEHRPTPQQQPDQMQAGILGRIKSLMGYQ